MITAALTGNIGMGKSTVLALFGELGAVTLDTDAIVSEMLRTPAILEGIKQILGPGVISPVSGELDKSKVADIIFSNDVHRKAYEDYLHPKVYERVNTFVMAAAAEIVVIEIPLLFESDQNSKFNVSITVYADEHSALDRLEKSGIDKGEAVRRLMCQMPIAEKVRKSTFTIDNSGDLNVTRSQVRQVLRALKAMATGG